MDSFISYVCLYVGAVDTVWEIKLPEKYKKMHQ